MAGGATASDTAISLSSGTGANLPDNTNTPYRVKVTNTLYPGVFEVMNVTNIAGDTITVERGKDETDAQIWGPSSVVAPRFIEPTYKVALTLVASRPVVIAESDDGIVLCEYSSSLVSGSTYETTYILHCHDPADGSVIWSHTISETTQGNNGSVNVYGSIVGGNIAFFARQWLGALSIISSIDCRLVLLSMSDGSESWNADVSAAHLSASGVALNTITPIMRLVSDRVVVATSRVAFGSIEVYTHSYAIADGSYSYEVATASRFGATKGFPISITPTGIVLWCDDGSDGPFSDYASSLYEVDGSSMVVVSSGLYVSSIPTTYSHAHSSCDDAFYVYSSVGNRPGGIPDSPAAIIRYSLYAYTSTFEYPTTGMAGPANVTEGPRFAEANGFIWGLSFINTDLDPIFSPRPAREDADGEFVTYTNAFTPISDRDGSMYFISADYDKVHNYIDDL